VDSPIEEIKVIFYELRNKIMHKVALGEKS
jgi:hypothetical protein